MGKLLIKTQTNNIRSNLWILANTNIRDSLNHVDAMVCRSIGIKLNEIKNKIKLTGR